MEKMLELSKKIKKVESLEDLFASFGKFLVDENLAHSFLFLPLEVELGEDGFFEDSFLFQKGELFKKTISFYLSSESLSSLGTKPLKECLFEKLSLPKMFNLENFIGSSSSLVYIANSPMGLLSIRYKNSQCESIGLLTQLIESYVVSGKEFSGRILDHNLMRMATLGRMSASIAHEINNPMFVISGFVSKIDQLSKEELIDKDQLSKYSKAITKNCKRINDIVSGLQVISRNSRKDRFEVSCLNKLVGSTLYFSKEKIRLGDITLGLSLCDGEVPIECHPAQIVQVLTNLLNNSYDSIIGRNGDRWIRIETSVSDDVASVKVIDSGEKLDDETCRKIMEPFFTTKEIGKGTGLGLSISKEIIKRHNGKFYIDQDCQNVCFSIDLPLLQYE